MGIYVPPLYTIHQYSENVFKIVMFKGHRDSDKAFLRDPETQQKNKVKLDNNFSRARSMVLQYALCNPWEYFFTGTLDARKFNRRDLDGFQERLMQFIRDQRKKYDCKLQVLLVPEHHKDGAWHIHGLVHDLPDAALRKFRSPEPLHLIRSDFRNWPDYMYKFGFCSLGRIKNPVATAFYVSKYVSKDMSQRETDLGKHLYFHSRPLRKAVKASDVYLFNPGLDALCDRDYDFCKTGMVKDAPWYFPYNWDGADVLSEDLTPPVPLAPEADFRPWEIDPFYEQLSFKL